MWGGAVFADCAAFLPNFNLKTAVETMKPQGKKLQLGKQK